MMLNCTIHEEGDPIYIIDTDEMGLIDTIIETGEGFRILAIEMQDSVLITVDYDPLILNLKLCGE